MKFMGLLLFLSLPIASAVAEETTLVSEIATQENVDVWVWRIGNGGSLLALELRNRGNNAIRVRGKIITVNSNTGATVRECAYEVKLPLRTFISKKTKCSLSGADALQATIDELVPEAD